MLEEIDSNIIAGFIARKQAQFDAIAGAMPGLQLIRSGERGSQIMLVISTESMYEGVVIGQLPHVVVERATAGKSIGRRFAPDHKKPLDRRAIDLNDAEVAAIIAAWSVGKSAITVPTVTHIYDRAGKLRS